MDKYSHYIDLFIPSIHDAGSLFTQELCLKYIASLTKGKTIPTVMDILMNYFLPHVGELNFQEKAYFVGHMVRELLMVFTGEKSLLTAIISNLSVLKLAVSLFMIYLRNIIHCNKGRFFN